MSDPNAFQPVLVIVDGAPALWRLSEPVEGSQSDGGALALAVFSDAERANQYGQSELGAGRFRIETPDPQVTVRVLAACVQQGVAVAVLNPTGTTAGRAFDLKAILRRVREQLRAGEPLQF
ncbi:hypothetical protein [Roseimaritima ulvae]|uniref:Uncharacterized protein n=1 Tax=Roseimaritima ulvae TaxID=980254 RepID=A0A5B9R656_9BACT|nr:hypothetical protein [Roseimaritima ulvae]QEG41991.1 hypothetical protein UC8_40200 [Roseimaritima ulvae]